jgi:hypothetical protein
VEIQSPEEGGVDLDDETGTRARFAEYTASLATVLGHADPVRPFADYCVGLLSAEGRKSVEPLAEVTAPVGMDPACRRPKSRTGGPMAERSLERGRHEIHCLVEMAALLSVLRRSCPATRLKV